MFFDSRCIVHVNVPVLKVSVADVELQSGFIVTQTKTNFRFSFHDMCGALLYFWYIFLRNNQFPRWSVFCSFLLHSFMFLFVALSQTKQNKETDRQDKTNNGTNDVCCVIFCYILLHASYFTHTLGQLSLPSLRGR